MQADVTARIVELRCGGERVGGLRRLFRIGDQDEDVGGGQFGFGDRFGLDPKRCGCDLGKGGEHERRRDERFDGEQYDGEDEAPHVGGGERRFGAPHQMHDQECRAEPQGERAAQRHAMKNETFRRLAHGRIRRH